MAAQSPRRRGSRAFTVLLTFLLVGSLVAPIAAAEPVAAQSENEGCLYDAVNWWIFDCAPSSSTEYVNTTQAAKETKIDLHVMGQGEWDQYESLNTDVNNYLEDSETIASLEAKHAIATAYENNDTTTEADAAAQQAIQDYYAARQVKVLEDWSSQNAQLGYAGETANNVSEISNLWLGRVVPVTGESLTEGARLTGKMKSFNATLINGSTHSYDSTATEFQLSFDSQTTAWFAYYPKIDQWDESADSTPLIQKGDDNFIVTQGNADGGTTNWSAKVSGQIWQDRAYDNAPPSLSSSKVYDEQGWYEMWTALEEQANTMQQNYPSGFASDIYEKLDSGELTTSEVRSAEGMARYLSGDSNVTDQKFQQANIALLNLDRPMDGNTSSMVVHYEGATEVALNSTANETTREYLNPVNETYEGMLYAHSPSGGFETGTEYSTAELNGTPTFFTNGGETVRFYDGNFTITAMYDTDGNEVETVPWGGPNYSTYSADAFVQAIENASQERKIIVSQRGGGDSGGDVSIGDIFGNPAIGMVAVALVVALFIVGKAKPY